MKLWKTKNNIEVFRVLSGRSNAYLILNGTNFILVDTGKKTAFGRLIRKLDKLNVPIEKISTLILTHTHFDHCQSAKKIQEKSGCRIIASYLAVDTIQKGFTKLPKGTFPLTKLISKFGNRVGDKCFGYEPFRPDILIDGDFEFKGMENGIKIINSAGHSADSISILVENEIAIVGDAMFGIFPNSIFPPYADDISELIESWGKLLKTDCRIFLPGHGREIKRELLEIEFEKYTPKNNNKP